MPTFWMTLPVELDVRSRDGCAVTGTDARGKRVHFDDLVGKNDRVPTGSSVDRDGESTGDTFGPDGVVIAWPPGRLRIVEPRVKCDTFGHATDEGVCSCCGYLVGSVDLTGLPHVDYGAAARELAEIHQWLRTAQGLVQSEGDGEWGRVSVSIEATEWDETGSTLDAILAAVRNAAMEGWCRHEVETGIEGERVAAIREVLTSTDALPVETLTRITEIVGDAPSGA